MKEYFENKVMKDIETETQNIQILKTSYPLVKNLCSQVVGTIRSCLSDVKPTSEGEYPDHVKNILSILAQVEAEPSNMMMRISESQGFIRGVQKSMGLVEEATAKEKRHEEKIEEVASKISAGDLDPDARRKVGDRPEKLKNVRLAKEKLSEEQDS